MIGNFRESFNPMNSPLSATFSATINNKELEKIFDLNKPTGFELEGTVARVPKRKHKKRRIAKKWAKKYGYYEIKIHAHVDDVETMSTKETFDCYLSNIYYTLEG